MVLSKFCYRLETELKFWTKGIENTSPDFCNFLIRNTHFMVNSAPFIGNWAVFKNTGSFKFML